MDCDAGIATLNTLSRKNAQFDTIATYSSLFGYSLLTNECYAPELLADRTDSVADP